MDICPGFWEWLEVMREAGRVASIKRVLGELSDQDDSLSTWASARDSWFLPDNDLMANSLPAITAWVYNQRWNSRDKYTLSATAQFFSTVAADLFLVAYAKGNGLTLVTQEAPCNGPAQVKIPTVCNGVGVLCINLTDMLRAERVVMRTCAKTGCVSDCHRA